MTAPILDIANLNISFTTYGQKVQTLFDVSMTIKEGERVALIGQSGSGKTVTMRTIIGTLPTPPANVDSGSIRYNDRELLSLAKRERDALKGAGISIVLQDPLLSFNPVLTIGKQMDDIVRFADLRKQKQRSTKERKAHILETLRLVQLPEGEQILRSYPMMLSGGMRQRVLIAMALLNKPKLLIADEPGTALDVTTQQEILDLLNKLVREEGLSLLLITHNLGVVREMADRVYVMEKGHIVETGSLEDVFSAPKHPYTIKLMDAVPPLYGDRVKNIENTDGDGVAIRVSDVSKTFVRRGGLLNRPIGEVHAVKNISLEVKQGDIFGIAGESGSGKTTLAKMLLGLYQSSSGKIEFSGKDVSDLQGTVEFRRHVQIVYQNPGSSLNPKRTIADQLALPLTFSGFEKRKIKDRTAELLEMVDLPAHYASMYPHELSGGQKQRVAIARALSVEPKVLVLDEPTSALDVLVQNTVIDLLHRLRKEFNLTYVFISHDLSLMRNFCNRIAVMFRGEMCEHGATKDVFANPQHLYTQALISSIPVISAEEVKLKPTLSKQQREEVLATSTALSK